LENYRLTIFWFESRQKEGNEEYWNDGRMGIGFAWEKPAIPLPFLLATVRKCLSTQPKLNSSRQGMRVKVTDLMSGKFFMAASFDE
jgi:hypothetical protein